jgi:hypothetical protein
MKIKSLFSHMNYLVFQVVKGYGDQGFIKRIEKKIFVTIITKYNSSLTI